MLSKRASLVAEMVKNLPASVGDPGSIPGLGRSPREGNGYSLQYSCLENLMDRGAWWATVCEVAKRYHISHNIKVVYLVQERCSLGCPVERVLAKQV